MNTNVAQNLSGGLKGIYLWLNAAVMKAGGDKGCQDTVVAHLTCEDWGKWLHWVKRTFQSARLHCVRQQLEHAVLADERDNITLSNNLKPTAGLRPTLSLLRIAPSYVIYLSVAIDFNEGAVRVESSCPTGVDVCSIVVVENPYVVSTLQLGTSRGRRRAAIKPDR